MLLVTVSFLASLFAFSEGFFERESYIVIIGSGERTCYSKSFTKSVKVIFEYRVTEGGNKDIDTRVISPNGLVIYKELRKNGDEISFIAQNGDFKFCFSNEFSKITGKRIAFNIRPYDQTLLAEEAGEAAVPKVRGALESFCDDIHMLMTSIVDFQMKYRVRESMGRYVAERLNSHVLWWSLFQGVIVMATGFGQVFIFKKFFTETRPSSKPAAENNSVVQT